MTAPHASSIIDGYLAKLEADAADLPAADRRALLDGVRGHITEARAEMQTETDADLLNLLDRLGDPAELTREERERQGLHPPEPRRPGLLEIGALILTPLLWPVGVILLWTSNAWNVRDKLIGSLVLPGGLFTSLLIGSFFLLGRTQVCRSTPTGTVCSGGVYGFEAVLLTILLLAVILSPILSGIYLGIRLRRSPHLRSAGAALEPG